MAQEVEQSSTNQKVGDSIPSLCSLHVKMSLGKTLNPILLPIAGLSLSLSPLPLHICPVPARHVFLSLGQSPGESSYVSAQSRTLITVALNKYHVGIVCCF